MRLLRDADGRVKVAVVMHRRSVDSARAVALLDACNGNLRLAISPA
jgi:N-acetylmuramic acid 6-phosphate (MurNAc-6-P) etherase